MAAKREMVLFLLKFSRTLNQRAAGSNPAKPTSKIKHLSLLYRNDVITVGTYCWHVLQRAAHFLLYDMAVLLGYRDRAMPQPVPDHFERSS